METFKPLYTMYTFTPLTHSEICERIEKARKRHSFNKSEFCQMMGYNPTILNKWLKGANFSSKSYRSAMDLIKKLDEAPKQTEIKFTPKPIEKPNYGVLTLEAAIKMVKDAGYKVSKRVETWEEI